MSEESDLNRRKTVLQTAPLKPLGHPHIAGSLTGFALGPKGRFALPFTYEEFEETRHQLIADVNQLMTDTDRQFLISFEQGNPQWEGYEFEYFKDYPSVKWKLLNLQKLKKQNPEKLNAEADKLKYILCGNAT